MLHEPLRVCVPKCTARRRPILALRGAGSARNFLVQGDSSMARKSKTRSRRDDSSGNDSGVRDSAQKIWLAGLGAFERAKTEGPRMFETLVEQGRNMGARAVGAAD